MADVDFSNAVLDVVSENMLTYGNYLGFDVNSYLMDSSGNYITNGASRTIISNTPSKVSILFTGAFGASGNTFYMRGTSQWKVSNISFSNGDTYAFVIDIETSGNA